jgi:hypothetical protein
MAGQVGVSWQWLQVRRVEDPEAEVVEPLVLVFFPLYTEGVHVDPTLQGRGSGETSGEGGAS